MWPCNCSTIPSIRPMKPGSWKSLRLRWFGCTKQIWGWTRQSFWMSMLVVKPLTKDLASVCGTRATTSGPYGVSRASYLRMFYIAVGKIESNPPMATGFRIPFMVFLWIYHIKCVAGNGVYPKHSYFIWKMRINHKPGGIVLVPYFQTNQKRCSSLLPRDQDMAAKEWCQRVGPRMEACWRKYPM